MSQCVYVSFVAEVSQTTVEGLLGVCAQLASQGTTEVCLMMSTPGGQVSQGITAYNVLRSMPFKLRTHNTGNVDSIGNAIFLAGDERSCEPGATFMFHGVGFPVQSETRLEERHLRELLVNITREQDRIGAIIADRTTISAHEVKKLFRRAETRNAQYAKTNGIVQSVGNLQIPPGAQVHSIVFQRQPIA